MVAILSAEPFNLYKQPQFYSVSKSFTGTLNTGGTYGWKNGICVISSFIALSGVQMSVSS